jgi:hypothetical protein
MRAAKRRELTTAKAAVARKQAVNLHRVWLDGTAFRWGADDAAAANAR